MVCTQTNNVINPLYLISITINQKVCYLVDLVVNIYDTVEFCSIVIKKKCLLKYK